MPNRKWNLVTFAVIAAALTGQGRASVEWRKNIVGPLEGAWAVSAGDLNGNGRMDIAAVGWSPGDLVWFRNDGNRNFTRFAIGPRLPRPRAVFVADINDNSRLDLLTVTDEDDDRVLWYENDGAGNFTQHTVGALDDGEDVFAIDLDQDGHMDVVGAALWGTEVAWYRNDGAQNFTRHSIERTSAPVYAVWPVDLDQDGDIDIVSGIGLNGNGLWWYENDGGQNFVKRMIDSDYQVKDIWVGDINGNGNLDLFTAGFREFTWWENDGRQSFTKHTIHSTGWPNTPISIYGGDLNGNGHIDAVAADLALDRIFWFENDGAGNFAMHVLDSTADGAAEVYVVDMDGDGDLDVLAALAFDDRIVWYENLSASGKQEAGPAGLPTVAVPSHFSNRITIRFGGGLDRPAAVRLFDGLGRMVYAGTIAPGADHYLLAGDELAALGPGAYFMRLVPGSGGQPVMRKLVKP